MNKTKKVRIETPIGAIESDSGNHLVDIGTVLMLLMVLIGLIAIHLIMVLNQIELEILLTYHL